MSTTTPAARGSGNVTQRANTAIRLGMTGSERALPELSSLAGDAAESVRAAAAEGLGLLHTPTVIPVLERLLDDPCAPVARNAAAALYLLATMPQAMPAVRKMARSPRADVRREAMGCALQLNLDDGMQLLTDGLTDADDAIRLAAAETFLLLACASAVDTRKKVTELVADPARLEALCNSPDVLVRRIFATALGNLGEFVPDDWFEALSNDPDSEVRHQTVRSVVRCAAHQVRHLLERALSDPDPGVAIAALQSLLQWDGSLSIEWLDRLLASPDSPTRAYAVRLADDFPDDQSVPLLEKALADPDPEVAGTAATSLLVRRPEPAIAWFRKTAQTGAPEQRSAALQRAGVALTSLGHVPGRASGEAVDAQRAAVRRSLTDLLASLVAHADADVREQAARELMSGIDIADSPALCAALDDPHLSVRAVVADALHTTRDVDLLVRSIKNDSPGVRRAATSGLRLTRGTDLIGPLTGAMDDTDHEVRWRAIELLGYLGRRTGMAPHPVLCRRLPEIAADDGVTVLREFADLSRSRIAKGSILPAVDACWPHVEDVLGVYACWAVDRLLCGHTDGASDSPSVTARRAECVEGEIRITAAQQVESAMLLLHPPVATPARGTGQARSADATLHVDDRALARVEQALAQGQLLVEPAVVQLVSNHLDACRNLPSADPDAWPTALLAPYRQAATADANETTSASPIEPAVEDWIVAIEPIVVGCASVLGLPWMGRELAAARRTRFELLEGLHALACRLGHTRQADVLGLAQAGLVPSLDDPPLWRDLLDHEDVNVRASAAAALVAGTPGSATKAVGVLRQTCAPDSGAVPETVLQSALALADAGHDDVTEPGARLLLDARPEVRNLAIRALAAMGSRVDPHTLGQTLEQADHLVTRLAVAEAMVDRACDVPDDVLACDPDNATENVALLLLRCRQDDPAAWRELVLVIEEGGVAEASLLAAEGIARVRIRPGVGVLQNVLRDPVPTECHAVAAAGLMEMDHEAGRNWLRNQMRDRELARCALAVKAALLAGRHIQLTARGVPRCNQGRFLA